MANLTITLKDADIADIKTAFDACSGKKISITVDGMSLPMTFSYSPQDIAGGETLLQYGKRIISTMSRCLPKVYKLNSDRTDRYIPDVQAVPAPAEHVPDDIIT